MTAALVEHALMLGESAKEDLSHAWEFMLGSWRRLDVPEGWRAEIEEGHITLSPPPAPGHNFIAQKLHRSLIQLIPEQWGIYQTLGVQVAPLERLYIPDLVVMPDELVVERMKAGDNGPLDAAEAALAVEITSFGNAGHDRAAKLHGYAYAGVPLYLLIDRFDEAGPTVTLFSEPVDAKYRTGLRRPFGERIELPEPFTGPIDTSAFVV